MLKQINSFSNAEYNWPCFFCDEDAALDLLH